MGVPLLDLRAQYKTIRTQIDVAVAEVVESQGFVMGPRVEGLERDLAAYLGVDHAIGCASGTDALLLPLRALNPRPGDEVVLPAFTFFATAGAVWNAGFKPVFCDVDPHTFNVTGETLEAVVGDRTRVIVPVHLFGQMAPMREVMAVAERVGALVLEDAAQSIGARQEGADGDSRAAGSLGWAGSFSFFPTKNLGAFGDGGLVTTADPGLADRVGKLRLHGGLQMYHHEMVGTNSRLDALQAAVLRAKLPYLDGWNDARRANAQRYDALLADVAEVIPPTTEAGNYHVYNQYTVRARRRDELKRFLAEKGIGSGVYYPVPLHLQECFSDLGGREGMLPVAEKLCSEVLSLPVYPELETNDLEEVVGAITAFYGHA